MYLNRSVLELALVRFFLLQIILVFVFYLYEEKIVFFLHNFTIKDLIYITTYYVILFSVMLAFFSIFIHVSNYIELAIVSIIPGLNGSTLRMDISKLLNPTTPPASPGNNAGSSGNGGGTGGGGSGGNNQILPLAAHHGTNQSNDHNTGANGQAMPSSFPPYNPAGGNQPHATELANILDEARTNRCLNHVSGPMLTKDQHILLKGYLKETSPLLYHSVYVDFVSTRPNPQPTYSRICNNPILTRGLRNAP